MSNDHALLSNIEQAAESLEMVGVLSSNDDDIGLSLWLSSSVHRGLMGQSASFLKQQGNSIVFA